MNMHDTNNIADTDTVDTVDTVNTIDTVDTVNICTPLDAHRARHGVLSLQCIDWCGKINLRGDIDNAQFAETVQQICGVDAPRNAGEVAVGEQCTLFWLAPDEWLIHCPLAQTKPLLDQLHSRLHQQHFAATEISDYYVVLELNGADAADALARGCPLDLHPHNFARGQCAQTRFGNASVLLYKPDDARFYIQVRWSFAEYVWEYLNRVIDSLDACRCG